MNATYRVFISHAADDTWVAEQIAHSIEAVGCSTFLDVKNIPTGADFKAAIRSELNGSHEFVALFTPWSAKRSWVWIEIGAAWAQSKPVIAVFHGMWISDLRDGDQGAAVLDDINALSLNDFPKYVSELAARAPARMSR